MASISIQGLGKTYDDGTVALAPTDLVLDEGGFLVLVGPSGCGKSTLLRLIAGLEEATCGRILIGERDVTGLAPERRDLAMVFQNYALYPHLSVAENIGFPLRMAGLPRAVRHAQVLAMARLLELEPLLARRPAQLSGGQRQRVAMGRALVRQPAAFLMDEPLSNLDARLRGQMRAEIAALQRRLGVSTIYVTHDQVEAMTLGDRICVLRAGRVQQIGSAAELYRAPANRFVAGFLGQPPMHLVQARLAIAEGRPELRWPDDGRLALDPTLLQRRPALAADPETAVAWGLRPEHLRPDPAGELELHCIHSERLGHECLVHCEPPWPVASADGDDAVSGPLTLRMPGPEAPAVGSRLRVALDSAALLPFRADGSAIATADPGGEV